MTDFGDGEVNQIAVDFHGDTQAEMKEWIEQLENKVLRDPAKARDAAPPPARLAHGQGDATARPAGRPLPRRVYGRKQLVDRPISCTRCKGNELLCKDSEQGGEACEECKSAGLQCKQPTDSTIQADKEPALMPTPMDVDKEDSTTSSSAARIQQASPVSMAAGPSSTSARPTTSMESSVMQPSAADGSGSVTPSQARPITEPTDSSPPAGMETYLPWSALSGPIAELCGLLAVASDDTTPGLKKCMDEVHSLMTNARVWKSGPPRDQRHK